MAERSDPLGGFDVNDFFKAIETRGGIIQAFAPEAPVPQLPAPETDPNFAMLLRNFQMRILLNHFNGRTLTDIRKDALNFKKTYELNRKETLSRPADIASHRFYELTTLKGLEDLARETHETLVKKAGQALPGSHDHAEMQREAGMWDVIHQHVQAAAELPDE